jgi:Zn-dependent peptidase ImmA (M78 family)
MREAMIEHREDLARKGLTEALRLRKHHNFALNEAVCPYDLAEKLGVRVYFDDSMPSMEGAYVNDEPPKIIVTSLRSIGRMAYSCAHEIGHNVFGHAGHVNQAPENPEKIKWSREEFLAEVFAGFLLMPSIAVRHGFSQRGWSCGNCTPKQVFVVAGWLGVGYTTLVNHMCHSLKRITITKAKELCKVPVKTIKRDMVGKEWRENVFWVDRHWIGRPIDVQVGDIIIAQEGFGLEGNVAEPVSVGTVRQAFKGVRPGIGRLSADDGSWAAFVRVSRREYKGWGRYRHLEDPEHE